MPAIDAKRSPLRRCAPSLFFLILFGGEILAFAIPLWRIGRNSEDQRVMFKNFRAPTDFEARFEYTMRYSTRSTESNDVIFFGSSTGMFGVNPVQLRQETGLNGFNLAIMGFWGIEPYRVILDAYIAHHPKPRVVCICVGFPELLVFERLGDEDDMKNRFFWCYGSGERARRPPHRDPIKYYVGPGLWNLFGAIRGGVEPRLDERIPNRRFTYNEATRFFDSFRGAWLQEPLGFGRASRHRLNMRVPSKIPGDTVDSLRSFAAECRQRGIRLLLRTTPLVVNEHTLDARALDELFASLARDCPGLEIGRPALLEFEPSEMDDAVHANEIGSRRLTTFIGAEIKALLSAAAEVGDGATNHDRSNSSDAAAPAVH